MSERSLTLCPARGTRLGLCPRADAAPDGVGVRRLAKRNRLGRVAQAAPIAFKANGEYAI